HDPMFLAADFTTVLLTENMADLNKTLVQNPYIDNICIDLPGDKLRDRFIEYELADTDFEKVSEVKKQALAQQSAGLNFVNLRSILSNARQNKEKITHRRLTEVKKELIESEAYGLLEFVESEHTLDDVAGHNKVKDNLRQAVKALQHGHREVLPMGYLICGPVGTGKTYLVNCFAGEIGIAMVRRKNFRSQWQGVTEGNLEKILNLLQAMAPVAVTIDEADAYLGNRNASGDSGVSSRVFSKIASFMSDTRNRGRILWFLMTARPDLMP